MKNSIPRYVMLRKQPLAGVPNCTFYIMYDMQTKSNTSKPCVLIITTLSSFLTPFMGSSINIALPTIGDEFAMDAVLLSWVSISFILAAAMFLVPFGKIADIYGRKMTFRYGIVIYTVSSFLSALSPDAMFLIAIRFIQGAGGAMIFGTGIAILTSVFPADQRGKVLGINVAAVYGGLSIGPFIGGLLTQHFGWRSIFGVNVLLGLAVLVLIVWKLKGEWAEAKGERFDLVGSMFYSVTLIALMYGFTLLPSTSGALLILASILGAVIFIRLETKARHPLLDLRVFRDNRTFAFSNIAAFINYGATFAVSFLLSLYLQYIKELSPQDAGLILVSQPIVMTVFSPFAGRLSDRLEPRIVASLGMGLTVIALFLFTFIDRATTLQFIVGGLICLGFGFALFSSPNTNAIMGSVERRFYGVASGMLGTMRLTGQMLSMGIVVLIFTFSLGKAQITPAYYPVFLKSMNLAFMIFTAFCVLGIAASLARGKVR